MPVIRRPGDTVLDREWRMTIGGDLLDAIERKRLPVIDPATEATVAEIPAGSAADVDRAVAAAARAFGSWAELPVAARAEVVRRIADTVEANSDELGLIDTIDNGTPIRAMRGEAHLAAQQIRFFAGLATELRGQTIPTPDAVSLDYTVREPFGVVGRIIPFNHPLMFAASKLAAPLMAGNTVVLKPSQDTSLSALRLGELLRDVVPPGVVNVVTGSGGTVGDALVAHPDVPRIAFIGSSAVGREIQRRAASLAVKSVTLELGGKNPIIVFADAKIESAIEGALRGMNFGWQGQSCGSTSRLFVHRSIFDEFVEKLASRMDALVVGDPRLDTTDVGAIVSRRQYEKVRDFVELGESDPTLRLVAGGLGGQTPAAGLFIPPTLFVASGPSPSTLITDEIFGPVLVAMPFDTAEEALDRANALPYGLTASIWTEDLATAFRSVQRIRSGYVWVNWSSTHVPGAPFGGVKGSGLGREEGTEELHSYTQAKNVYIRYGD